MTQFDLANVGDVGLWMQDITHRDWRGLAGLFLFRPEVGNAEAGRRRDQGPAGAAGEDAF